MNSEGVLGGCVNSEGGCEVELKGFKGVCTLTGLGVEGTGLAELIELADTRLVMDIGRTMSRPLSAHKQY